MNTTDDELLEICKEKLQEILESPREKKAELMRVDGKLIINFLNYFKTMRQAESGKDQAIAVIAKLICSSKDDMVEFFKNNLPGIIIHPKQLKQ
ncbi:MAG: hypothetical protein JRI72_17825 [Deltaproteobacteria bacterium]|nr:hypothetical protein [Deltaproteobacteria bacterium]